MASGSDKANLSQQQRLVQTAFEASPNGIVMMDRQGSIMLVNAQIEKMFGYTQDELLGQPIEILVPQHLRESHPELREAYFERPEARPMGVGRELLGAHKDGSTLRVAIDLNVAETEQGQAALASIINISDRQRFTKGLERRVDERTRELQDASRAAMNMMRDADRARSFAEQSQADAEQAREDVERHARDLELSRAATMNMMKDIDRARQELDQRAHDLARSNKELDDFAYVASHDLRSPLRAIHNLAKWIEEDEDSTLSEQSADDLEKLVGRVARMDGLLNGLLQFSRVGRKHHDAEEIDCGAMAREMGELLDQPQEFTIEVADPMPTITAQRVPLEQVLRNLIDNAIKHHDRADGRIVISAEDNGTFVKFSVSDDGPGIAPDYQEKVFQIFETIKTRAHVEGSGMGLALVKKIVESCGGTISLESGEGTGATFRFMWPKHQ